MDGQIILIVDDDTEMSGMIARRLKKEAPHLSIVLVSGGPECMDYLRDNSVSCILSDYQMPDMDGMELLRKLRESGNGTPFIFITGQGNEEVAREAFKTGANDYFTKEIGFAHFTRIVNSVEQAIRQRRAELIKVLAEKELLEERNKLKAIISSIGDGLSIQDTEYRIVYQNVLIEKMGGSHVGKYCYSAYEGKETVCEDCPLRKSFEDGGTHRAVRSVVKFGKPLVVDITTSPIHDSSGKVIGGIELVRNITGRMEREAALEEAESRFRGLVEGSRIGFVIIQDGRFAYVNPRLAEIIGYTIDELTGKETLSIVHPEDRELVSENIRKRIEGELETTLYRMRLVHTSGIAVPVEVHGSRFMFNGRPAIVGTVLEIGDALCQSEPGDGP